MINIIRYAIFVCFFVFGFIFLIGDPVYAYLDPGTGSMILQGIIAGLAAVAVMGRLYWQRFLRFFGLRKDKSGISIDQDDGK